ncbi:MULTISPECIES: acyl-CoA thioesterase [Paenibacillus]|uniref:acyl-CoA thioesterase n=1 Tax=Paenibacillus TaxID=44249 RepID=UPI0008846D55|nr:MULTISPECIES: thioesterase family protein [Paenibacillus]SDF47039.1 acyl-CoA thioester hydrolase [Paenibacillus sp. cl6col]
MYHDVREEDQSVWFGYPLRVRYQETDRMNVVFHGNYVTWFEVGRTEWIRALGMNYRDLEARGLLLPVVDLQVKFKRPAYYDDRVMVYTRLMQLSPLRLTFESQVCRIEGGTDTGLPEAGWVSKPSGKLLVEGTTTLAWLNADWRPIRLEREAEDVWSLLERMRPTS